MENQGNCLAMDWWALFLILLLVYQHVSITEFLNLQSVDTRFSQRNAFFQVDNTPLWQNWINSIMNWSICCFERNSIPVFPGNEGMTEVYLVCGALLPFQRVKSILCRRKLSLYRLENGNDCIGFGLGWVEQWMFIHIHYIF